MSSWSRVDGAKPRVVVVHPRLPGDKEELVSWDAEEALALAKAMGWTVLGIGDDAGDADETADDAPVKDEDAPGEDVEVSARDRSVVISDEHVVRIDRLEQRLFFPVRELCSVATRLALSRADILFVNAALSPTQQRSLEAVADLVLSARQAADAQQDLGGHGDQLAVFDRRRLILAIFARRAATPLARLRVELAEAQEAKAKLGAASLQGIAGQLRRVGEALARVLPAAARSSLLARGGSAKGVTTSFNSSPQTTRQKKDRTVDDKERKIKEELARLQMQRSKQRQQREQFQTIALVGYTNVGKSAVVNRLADSNLLVKDGVFVTLDIAARRVSLPSGGECYILDSVGFVKDLPLEACEAFQATIEELRHADLVLHVRDMSHPSRDEHSEIIKKVLGQAGVDVDRRIVEVWNKSDLISKKEMRHFLYVNGRRFGTNSPVICVSAKRGDGFDELVDCIDRRLTSLAMVAADGQASAAGHGQRQLRHVTISSELSISETARLWAALREFGRVVDESVAAKDDAVSLDVWMDESAHARFVKQFGDAIFT